MILSIIILIIFFTMIVSVSNEQEVGRAIKKSGISRSDVFVVTKILWTDHGYERCKAAFADSIKK